MYHSILVTKYNFIINRLIDCLTEPDHLVQPAWWNEREDIVKECERKGIPIMPGRRYKFKSVSSNYNQVRW